ncbi:MULTISPECIES: ABC transporter ATP-binding protein [Mammaliicoccus]|uniref:Phosphate ABC transporter ATP-binding protein n=1 Tax=Mammaliicoccus lentus TaxID=42858 RepID=A0AAX3W1C8_MAMLE|nr:MULTISPECIES: phosphate ABC transporter ATP-binding protein [Mammaliicoccus]HIS17372.1 phosphate ABC transporter ATP-binding protein [Candidatus Coprovivens excrementavium]MBF0749473.1 phosphate ABC transporter ATP-binding protein [Mammaliicoccus lentus]MBU6113743.1 phosphate ABC transporter ATP-binding protein [Mammaliicoccus lentus]MEB5686124.1 phosphate ABC transporter ATP-binding protein [Mammaliicoccus lentus]OAO18571.1 amino acid ABC transporter ATP-binding protein [Mammaliicoccus len
MSEQVDVEFKNIGYEIEGSKILNKVNGKIYQGKITTIIGPSGAGKSTLLSFINALNSPTEGDIFIDGHLINEYEAIKLRRKVQLVSQEATMINGTVKDNLELPLTLQNRTMTDKEAEGFLKDVDLPISFLNKDSKELSGGEKQKLSLARSLVTKPSVMLLDEVTSALDRSSVEAIESLLTLINKKHDVTMIWITHDVNQAIRMSDYIWVMMNGEVVEIGTSEEIRHTTNKKVKKFIGAKI